MSLEVGIKFFNLPVTYVTCGNMAVRYYVGSSTSWNLSERIGYVKIIYSGGYMSCIYPPLISQHKAK